MGWGTDFKASVFLNREVYSSKHQLEDAIAERESNIQNNREILLMIAMANPKDLVAEDEDVVYANRNRVNDIVEDILEEQYKITLERLYLDAIEDGTAKFEDNGQN